VAAGEYIHQYHADWFMDHAFREHYNTKMFTGAEFDATMMRIAAMNLQLHGIEHPNLVSKDALSESNIGMSDQFSLILANPPFKGSLDYDSVESGILKRVKTKKTELLFLGLILRALKTGGRCAVIVPDGVMFGSSNAHKQIRQELVENQQLQAVISMPSGVFKPYAGVSTAILLFTKTNSGGTDRVWFYDMQADGFSLDDKRNPVVTNDISDIVERWHSVEQDGGTGRLGDLETKGRGEGANARTEKSFLVPFVEIKSNDWDLSINRYKEVEHREVEYDSPAAILQDIRQLDAERAEALKKLEELLG
jgi:type I restriction enzyme M protein